MGNSLVSEVYTPTFGTLCPFHLHRWVGTYPPVKMGQTGCSETWAYKIQMPGNYPEESIQNSEHGKSLKSRKTRKFTFTTYCTETYQKNEMPVNAVQVYWSTPHWSEQTFTTKVQIAALVMFQVHLLYTLFERHSMGQTLTLYRRSADHFI